jgi:fatty acid synthase subunit alpha, fungi type
MTYDTMDKDGHVKTLADIDVRCPKYTFSHPAGLLFATQFAQIALVVTQAEKAAFEDMRVKGLRSERLRIRWTLARGVFGSRFDR